MKSLICFALIAVIYEVSVANAQDKTGANIIFPKYNGDHVVEVGSKFELICQGKDKTTELKWQRGTNGSQSVLVSNTDGFTILHDATGSLMKSILRKDPMTSGDADSYTCYPSTGNPDNGDAKNVRSIRIKVNLPVINIGKNVTMKCEVIGITSWNRPIEWKKNDKVLKPDSHIVINSTTNGSLIYIEEAQKEDFGNYSCIVNVHNNSFEQEVSVMMGPHVKDFEKSKNLVQGDSLRLKCEVTGDPTPEITWLKDGKILSHPNAEYSENKGVANASLVIHSLDFEDRGQYVCRATNIHGEHEAEITVRVKDKLAALWPFLGICAEVAILCTIIFIYERRRAKKMEEEEAKEEAGHLTNSHDHKGQEVRQRKS